MSTHRNIDAICAVIIALTLVLTILFMNGEAFGIQIIVDEDAEDYAGFTYFTENDQNGSWSTLKATQIVLSGDHAEVFGGGAYAYDGGVMINNAGKYVVTGTMNDGGIVVDTDKNAKVWIMLNGTEISNQNSACLDVEQADKVFLTLGEGTENRLKTTAFSQEAEMAGIDGALFSRDDLTINGTGGLTVSSPSAHGIVGNDELVITGGNITVEAAADALHVNDGLRIMLAEMTLTAGDDGISVTGDASELYMESGNIKIKSDDKGMSAENTVHIVGGMLLIESDDDGVSAAGSVIAEGGDISINAGDDGIHSDSSVSVSDGIIRIPVCYEGIEAITIDISGGDITVYSEDDGLNANGDSDGFGDSHQPLGEINGQGPMERPISEKQEENAAMPQGARQESVNGSALLENNERTETLEERGPGQMPEFQTEDGQEKKPAASGEPVTDENALNTGIITNDHDSWIHISGGTITIINDSARDADGLDSNGDIIISGGVIRISLTNSGSNSALDYGSEGGGVMEISGGNVIACGSYSMAEGFDTSSSQCSALYNIKRGVAAGTAMALEDCKGNVLCSYVVPCSFSSIIISCPEMQIGESYTIVIGDSAEKILLDEISAAYGDVQSEGFGGPMNWGAMKFRPGP